MLKSLCYTPDTWWKGMRQAGKAKMNPKGGLCLAQPAAQQKLRSGTKLLSLPMFAGFLLSLVGIQIFVVSFSPSTQSPGWSWSQSCRACFNVIFKGLKDNYLIIQKDHAFVVTYRPSLCAKKQKLHIRYTQSLTISPCPLQPITLFPSLRSAPKYGVSGLSLYQRWSTCFC